MKKYLYLLFSFVILSLTSCGSDDEPSVISKNDDAFNYFLNQQKVVKTLPANLETGATAPYYQIDDNGYIFMQVLSNEGSMAYQNQKIGFEHKSYSLLTYYETKQWPAPTSQSNRDNTPFLYDQQKLNLIQLALQYVGVNSEVNLAIRQTSDKGESPYLLYIRYMPDDSDIIPPSPVNIKFSSQTVWDVYGVTSAFTWRYFNKEQNLPANFPYTEDSATGFGGVLLVSNMNNDAIAYDAACPVEHTKDTRISVNSDSFIGVCPKCGSTFDLFSNPGVPLSGEACEKGYGLMRYDVRITSNSDGTIAYIVTR